ALHDACSVRLARAFAIRLSLSTPGAELQAADVFATGGLSRLRATLRGRVRREADRRKSRRVFRPRRTQHVLERVYDYRRNQSEQEVFGQRHCGWFVEGL